MKYLFPSLETWKVHGPRYFSIVFGQAVYVHTYNTYVTHTWPNYLIIECTAVARGCFVLYCATISRRENACRRSFDAASGKPGAKSTESDGHEGGKREKREARVPAPLPPFEMHVPPVYFFFLHLSFYFRLFCCTHDCILVICSCRDINRQRESSTSRRAASSL